jgi:hypothetical protein
MLNAATPGGMGNSHENPLLGGAEGVSLRGGSSGWGQPTPAPLQWRGIIFMLNGAALGGMGNSYGILLVPGTLNPSLTVGARNDPP